MRLRAISRHLSETARNPLSRNCEDCSSKEIRIGHLLISTFLSFFLPGIIVLNGPWQQRGWWFTHELLAGNFRSRGYAKWNHLTPGR